MTGGGKTGRVRRALATCAAVTLVGVLPGAASAVTSRPAGDGCRGAASLAPGSTCPQPQRGPVVPKVAKAPYDRGPAYVHPCRVQDEFEDRYTCEFGDRTAKRRVALVGNSHAARWLPALDALGRRDGFRVTTYFASGCFVTTVLRKMPEAAGCLAWASWVREDVMRKSYDLVVQSEQTAGSPADGSDPQTTFRRGYAEHLRIWVDAGANVLVIRDVPRPGINVPACVRAHPHNYAACSGSRAERVRPDPLAEAAAEFRPDQVAVADLTDYFCTAKACPGVIGTVIVYSDHSHLTATYSVSLAPYLGPHVRRALAR